MILKNSTNINTDKYWRYLGYGIVSIVLFALLYLILTILIPIATPAPPNSIFCDAEVRQGDLFRTGKNTFDNGNTQSNEEVYKGKFSSKVDTINQIGFKYKLRSPIPGERYKVSVWRYKMNIEGGYLIAASTNKSDFYKEVTIGNTNEDGWEKLELIFNIPPDLKANFINIYVSSKNSKQPIYFDNLLITKIVSPKVINAYNPDIVNIEIPQNWLEEVNQNLKNAISSGSFQEENNTWTKARVYHKDEAIPVELRIKGDWLDYLKTEQLSFDVKTKNAYAWNGIQRFTLEAPSTKNYLREWLFHQFLQKEDIIAPRYDFIKININNKNKGVFAYEEHFDKPLLEYNNRIDGPILKFSDEAYWQNLSRDIHTFGNKSNRQFIGKFDVAQVQPYRQQVAQIDLKRKQQFEIAQNLMQQYKYNQKPADEIFDVDKMAKFYAITDVLQAYHGIIWHNQRFYFNPKTAKIEPIGFDGFGTKVKRWQSKPFIGFGVYNKDFNDKGLYLNLFKNEKFVIKYYQYLYNYSDKEMLTDLLLSLESQLRQREMFIQRDSASYSFDESKILDNAQQIRSYLTPFNNISIQAFSQKNEGNGKSISITNYHQIPLEIIGFGKELGKVRDKLKSPKLVSINLPNQMPNFINYKVSQDIRYIYYRIPNIETIFHSEVQPWKSAGMITPEQELFGDKTIRSTSIFTVSGKNILFKKGNHNIKNNIVIPEGYQVNIPAGTKLDFINNSLFLSNSPVFMPGSTAQPIIITSSDNTGNGFSILQASGKSQLSNVIFSNLNTLSYKGWELTGSVTFYESDVIIEDCTFKQSNSLSALNIVRSQFDVLRSDFINNKNQGIETAYSEGNIAHCVFNTAGGSAVDIRNCIIKLDNLNINNCQENGILIGERSQALITTASITNTTTAVVSKDYSTVTIDYIELNNCQQGFTIFKSKPEFGSSTMEVKSFKAFNLKYPHLVEPGSILTLEGKVIKGS